MDDLDLDENHILCDINCNIVIYNTQSFVNKE
jgi:hypothetical protein